MSCGVYCTSPAYASSTHNFYWGGSRAFRWDPVANAGEGRFKFDIDFFPRKSGVGVAIAVPGGTIIGCSVPCINTFTPFIGQRIEVGHIDTDGKLDVAVLHDSSKQVSRASGQISSLQVALNKADILAGSSVTDVTLRFLYTIPHV